MLSAVGHPVAVNPDSKLERHARAHGWPVVIFSQRTKTVIRRTAAGIASALSPRASVTANVRRIIRLSPYPAFADGAVGALVPYWTGPLDTSLAAVV